MTDGGRLFVCLSIVLVVALLSMHEAHYVKRRWRIYDAHMDGLDVRVKAVEAILMEHRDL